MNRGNRRVYNYYPSYPYYIKKDYSWASQAYTAQLSGKKISNNREGSIFIIIFLFIASISFIGFYRTYTSHQNMNSKLIDEIKSNPGHIYLVAVTIPENYNMDDITEEFDKITDIKTVVPVKRIIIIEVDEENIDYVVSKCGKCVLNMVEITS